MAEKENMFYFEVSAKSGEGVNNMMYTCIALLPFFEQFKVDNNEILIQELIQVNNNTNDAKVVNVNNNREYLEKNSKYSSNIVLMKQNSNDKNKKKCACWIYKFKNVYIILFI